MNQIALPFKLSTIPKKSLQHVDNFDSEHQRALEGLPHYWKMSWGYFDIVIEPCGYPAKVPVDRLEDPNYKHVPVCPWEGKHDHGPFWKQYPAGWATA